MSGSRTPDIGRRRWRDIATILAIVCIFAAINFLPPDTSLAQVKKAGALTACVPAEPSPLISDDAYRPGYDVKLLQHIADALQVRLSLAVNPSIGQSFNPRNWRISRGQCEVIAGGVVTSPVTRGFLQVLGTDVEAGWMLVGRQAGGYLARGMRVAVFPGTAGLGRIALSNYLRELQVEVVLASSPQELENALTTGAAEAAVTDSLSAGAIVFSHPDWHSDWLAEGKLERYRFGIGLWKGDLTLKRAIAAEIDRLRQGGLLDEMRNHYGL